jgi:hypothetical protein
MQSRMFNALGFLVKFFCLCDPRAEKQKKYIEVLIDFAYDLLQNSNFNSAYSVYLGLKTVLLDVSLPKAIEWSQDKKLKKLENVFDD